MFVPGNCMEIRVESDRALPQRTEKPTPLLTARRNTSVPDAGRPDREPERVDNSSLCGPLNCQTCQTYLSCRYYITFTTCGAKLNSRFINL
jgi:hypothetical protein